jgi:hypothetical protein
MFEDAVRLKHSRRCRANVEGSNAPMRSFSLPSWKMSISKLKMETVLAPAGAFSCRQVGQGPWKKDDHDTHFYLLLPVNAVFLSSFLPFVRLIEVQGGEE